MQSSNEWVKMIERNSWKQIETKLDEFFRFRPLIINAMASCGNTVLITSLTNIETKLETEEVNTILTGVTVGAHSTEDTLRTLKKMYVNAKEETTKEQLLLAIGSQIHSLCNCKDDDIELECCKSSHIGDRDDDCPCEKLRVEFSNVGLLIPSNILNFYFGSSNLQAFTQK